jgi:fibronectin-binding autotransporter adhesin
MIKPVSQSQTFISLAKKNFVLPRTILAAAGIFMAQAVLADQEIWQGVSGTSTTTNWSDSANWLGTSASPSGNDDIFNGTGAVGTAGQVNNVVDQSFAINSLMYTNATGQFQTTLIPSGIILTDSGTYRVGYVTNDNYQTSVVITGGGTLVVNGNLQVGIAGSSSSTTGIATNDMSGLSNFVYNASSGNWLIAGSGGGTARAAGVLKLAGLSNNITVGTINLNVSGGNNTGARSQIQFGGGTNILNVGTFVIGQTKAKYSIVQFNALASASAGLRLRGVNGNTDDNSRANITLGDRNNTGSDITEGDLLLDGHYVDIKAGTLIVGQDRSGSGSSVHGGSGILQFDTGIIDATNVLIGNLTTSATAASATGMVMVAGSGILTVGTGNISLANNASGSTLAMGALIITNGGTVICSNNIIKATTVNTFTTITMSNGTLRVDGAIGSSTAPIDIFSITNSTLQLNIPNAGAAVTVATLNIGGSTNKINVGDINATILGYPAILPVIQYATANGTNNGSFNFIAGTLPPGGYTGFISNDVANSQVDLVVTGGPAPPRTITWSGRDAHNGNATTSTWDIGTTFDWLSNSTAVTYNDNGGLGGDIVTFDDTAATGTVTLHATVSPTGITVTNNTLNYTINDNSSGYALAGSGILNKEGSKNLVLDNSGGVSLTGGMDIEGGILQVGNGDAGGGTGTGPITDNASLVFNRNNNVVVANSISGSGAVTNNGTGVLTLSGANSFDGPVAVNSGSTLKIGNNSALGSTNSGTLIASGATLDVNSKNLGQEPVTISGVGTDGNGALINNLGSPVAFSNINLSRITFAGNTTIGGSGRIDLRSPSTSDPSQASLTMLGGGAFNLTKTGANQLALVGLTVDPNLADVDIQNGLMSIEVATTGLGDPSHTVTVENGATLGFYNMTNLLNKNIVLNGNGFNGVFGSLNNFAGNNTVIGPVTLNGNVGISFRASAGTSVGGTLTLSNMITGTGSFTKNDTNILVLAGTNSSAGPTTINDGALVLNGMSTNPNNVLTANASVLGLGIPVVFGGNGTNAGPVDIEDTLWPGVGGHPSTLKIGSGSDYPGGNGALDFGLVGTITPTAIFDLGSSTTAGGGVNDLVVVNGDFDPNFAHIKINPVGLLNTNNPYTLFTYTGLKNSSFNSSIQAIGGSRYSFTLNYVSGSPNAVTLNVSGGPALLKWNNNATTGIWDQQSSQNWLNTGTAASDVFYNQDAVVFDDSILSAPTPTTSINLAATVLPSVVTNNSSSANYTISGTGKISGSTGLVKAGSSTLTISTTNDFTGNVAINGGVVIVQNSGSLGATNGTVTIASGATLNLTASTANNGLNFGMKPFIISGSGTDGNGVIVNSGTNQGNAFQNVTMVGNTVFGGSARWDIRSPAATNAGATLSTGGNGYKLTKIGTNFIALSSVAIDPALGDIDVSNGTLSVETQTTSLGNTNNRVAVFNGAALWFWNLTNIINKPITLQTGSLLNSGSGNNTYNGPLTVAGDSTLSVVSLGLTLNGPIGLTGTLTVSNNSALSLNNIVSGAGGLIKIGSNTLTLNTNNTFSGGTAITIGTLALGVNGSISSSTNISIASGTTLNASGRSDSTLTLNSGQTLQGSGTLSGNLNNAANSTISIGSAGAVGKFTVTGNATLNGTTQIKLNKGSATNDVLIVNGGATFVGTLSLANLPGTLAAGDQFKIVTAGTYSGAFANIVPANPNNDSSLAWDQSSLNVNGILKVVSAGPPPQPHISSIGLNGTTLSLQATNGTVGGNWTLLQSTNVALPLAQWQTNRTGTFDGSGNLSTNIANVATNNQEFYILKQ